MVQLIDEFITERARGTPGAQALGGDGACLSYMELAQRVGAAAHGLLGLGVRRLERVAVYLEKREEAVAALFGASAAGAVFVPVNPQLRPEQVAYILQDSGARVLVTSPGRLAGLAAALPGCPDLRHVIVTGADAPAPAALPSVAVHAWDALMRDGQGARHRCIDTDMAALMYTSGSTGKPKGVVLSHRNLVAGAQSVSGYLGNTERDRILAVLPLSFDYGLSQLTTAFASGACAVLMNYLLPNDIVSQVAHGRITGLAAVPPLWIQLAQLDWRGAGTLRYITNSGGAMPRATLDALRREMPRASVFLMYGLTEAFRSTYLPPDQLALRPDSIGRAIPNAEVLVLKPDGSACGVGEPGELVHRGPLVALGYWNDPARTAERFRPLPAAPGLALPELAVWSGDTVRADAEGYLYFIGRTDEMIKTSGYRVSPTEVEEVVYASGLVAEAAALGVPHPVLGQVIALFATPRAGAEVDVAALLTACRAALPGYMVPAMVELSPGPLPRNPNGKIDRRLLGQELAHRLAWGTP
ncbi:acyl-CoA ligase (AMP-forming), exosortase A system-associated [Massilia glaciei]|uniref:Acyl-CoA ligase (AMP-forming), exosortase A system-associated n=1 Tax=Massilia glaciei TaxID=1524097 RepID=A0A2U2HJE6_9BURK|nr:acyl-CoA ligase (AMP-forming), exosortase A system-associated [Massilia glaciei]PWF47657.1 acyl-CoA ligase (AMP-forming), exosortase A system-associated [Massilia glaciei]